ERTGAGECLNAFRRSPGSSERAAYGRPDQLRQSCVSLAVQLDLFSPCGGVRHRQWNSPSDSARRRARIDVSRHRAAEFPLSPACSFVATGGRATQASAEAERNGAKSLARDAEPVRALCADLWIHSLELRAAVVAVADFPAADRYQHARPAQRIRQIAGSSGAAAAVFKKHRPR